MNNVKSNWKTTLAFLTYHILLVYAVYKTESSIILILAILCAYTWTLLKSSNELFAEVVKSISEYIKNKKQ